MLSLLTGGILLVLSPITIRKQKENKTEEVGEVILASGKLVGYAALLFLTVAPEIFYLAVSREYYEALPVVYPIAFSAVFLFLSNAASNCLIHYEKPVFITRNSVLSCAVCLLLSLTFINFFGYIGGAYATLASYFLLYLLNSIALRRMSEGNLKVSCGYHFWLLLTAYGTAVYLLRCSLFARILLLSALLLSLLPTLKKYKNLIFA